MDTLKSNKSFIDKASVKIPVCPICKHSHEYKLDIHRTMVMYSANEEKHEKRFTRLFICPTTSKEFEAEFRVKQNTSSDIEKIDIT